METVGKHQGRQQRATRPYSWGKAKVVLDTEWGDGWEEVVLDTEWGDGWEEVVQLEREIICSGCCAQVYKGQVVHDGMDMEVAVKVVHPDLYRHLEVALIVMSTEARLITWLVWAPLPDTALEYKLS